MTQTAHDGTVLTRTLAYDYLGRQTDESDGRGGSLHFEYDENGNRTLRKLTLPGGQAKTVSYGYDGRNRLSKVTDEAGTTSYTYGCRGNLVTHVTRPDGSVEDYGYDDADRLTSKAARDAQGHLIVSYVYAYDEANRRTSQTEIHGSGNPEITTYDYDDAGQLTHVSYPDGKVVEYEYDAAGNRTIEVGTSPQGGTLFEKSYTYDDLNELTRMEDSVSGDVVVYTYDANGNQIGKTVTHAGQPDAVTTFDYTSRDMLAQVTVGGSIVESLGYDDLGRRVRKNGEWAFWDGRSLAAETDVATGGILRGYTHGLDLIRENVLGQTAEAYTDVLGSVGALVPEGQGSTTAAHYRYDAFGAFRDDAHPGGDCTGGTGTLACQNPLTYTGHLYDPESGLFYFGARYYDPETGRFLTNDPVAGDALNPPSLHKYLYAYSSPMTFTDPWGEYAQGDNGLRWDPTDPNIIDKAKGYYNSLFDKDEARRQQNRDALHALTLISQALGVKGAYVHNPELEKSYAQLMEATSGLRMRDWTAKDRESLYVLFHKVYASDAPQDNFGKELGFGSTAIGQSLKEQWHTIQGAAEAPGYIAGWVQSIGEGAAQQFGDFVEQAEWSERIQQQYDKIAATSGQEKADAYLRSVAQQQDVERKRNLAEGFIYLTSGQAQHDFIEKAQNDPQFAYNSFMNVTALAAMVAYDSQAGGNVIIREAEGATAESAAQAASKARISSAAVEDLRRPYYRMSFREEIKQAAREEGLFTAEGKYIDPDTGRLIEGKYHIGHKYGFEHRRLVTEAQARGMTQQQFNEWVNSHPEWFQIQDPVSNMSHKYEMPGNGRLVGAK